MLGGYWIKNAGFFFFYRFKSVKSPKRLQVHSLSRARACWNCLSHCTVHPITTGSFSTFLLPPSSPLIWQSLCNLELKWLFLKMPWALGSWYFPLITVPHYHRKALSTSLALLIALLRLPWHILSFVAALCRRVCVSRAHVSKKGCSERARAKEGETSSGASSLKKYFKSFFALAILFGSLDI